MSTVNERLLNARLPMSVYKLCPNIPTELQQPNFDPIEYVNAQLKDRQFSADLLNQLISDMDTKIKNIDGQIEEIICAEEEPELPDLSQTTQLFNDLQHIQKQVQETQQNSAVFIDKMNRFNTARRQIDYLSMSVEFCKLFQETTTQFPPVMPSSADDQQALIKPFSTACCVQQYLIQLQDIQQLQNPYKQYNNFITLVKQMRPQQSHLQDAFNFWTTLSIKFGFLVAAGKLDNFYEEVSQQIFQESFPELLNETILGNNFGQKFEMFFKAHSKYMLDFEKMGLTQVIQGRNAYFEFLKQYGQGKDTAIHQNCPDLYIVEEDELYKKFDLYSTFFQQLASILTKKIQSQLARLNVEETVKQLKLMERLEAFLVQNETSVKENQLISVFLPTLQSITDYICQQMELFIQNQFLPSLQFQPKKQNNFFNDLRTQLNKLYSYLEFVPKKLEFVQAMQLNQKIFDLVTNEVLGASEKRLNFTQYVTPAIEKQTRGFKPYGAFNEMFRGGNSLVQLETFKCSGLMVVDFTDQEYPLMICSDLLKTVKYVEQFFDTVVQQLQIRVEPSMQEQIVNKFGFSDQQSQYTSMFEAATSSLLVGQLIFSSFYTQQQKRANGIVSARETFVTQFKQIEENIADYYEEMDLEMFKLGLFNSFLEQLGGFIVGNLIKDGISAEDLQSIKKSVDIIAQEFSNTGEIGVKKLNQVILVKQMKADGRDVERSQFIAIMGDVPGAAKFYDEVVGGIIAR
ncbi:Conserved_hypothetical protein [Hexamita inflata]|uniref:Uncharacterized protein n=1 Tax=Hexamita inflata TaxID=28002 RepID=A0AA86QRS8_9EUKA|nr:Conserved hypothetical protein [Hexamita inflata]